MTDFWQIKRNVRRNVKRNVRRNVKHNVEVIVSKYKIYKH